MAHIYFYALDQIFVLSRRICWLHFRLQHISYWRISLRFLERKGAPHKSLGAVDVQLIGGLDLLHVKNGSLRRHNLETVLVTAWFQKILTDFLFNLTARSLEAIRSIETLVVLLQKLG